MTEQNKNKHFPVTLDTALLILVFTLSLIYSRLIRVSNAGIDIAIHIASFLVLISVACYMIADFFVKNESRQHKIKMVLLVLLMVCIAIGPLLTAVNLRHNTKPNESITDSAVQTEEAVKMVLRGQNPYVEDYYKTPLEPMDPKSPALKHYVYLPMTFLLPVPFYLISQGVLGWFDLRLVYMLFYILLVYSLTKLTENRVWQRCLIIVFALNPDVVYYFVYGTNDIVATTCLVVSILLLVKRRYLWSAVLFGVALLTKQFIVLILPFYLLYLYGQSASLIRDKDGRLSPVIKAGSVIIAMVIVFALPFVLWNFNAFIDDIIKYPYGTSATSWNIAGWGLSKVALGIGLIKSQYDYYPALPFYTLILLPLTAALMWKQFRENDMKIMLLAGAITIFVFVVFSRFTHNNYFYYATSLVFLSYFGDFPEDKQANMIPAEAPG
jgi:hypothetical protein